jgi:hypothetical protein
MLSRLAALCLLTLAPITFAAAHDVSGTWKWDLERNGESREITMNAKQDGNKVTGRIKGPEGEIDIHNGRITEEGKLTFYIDLERNGNTMKIDFHGQVEGDNIEGKAEYTNRDGERRDIDWNPKRQGMDFSGKWNSSFKIQDGTWLESTLSLKQSGTKLTGKNDFNGNETEISDGKVDGDAVSFKMLRDRDGRTVTSRYNGKLQKDGSIKGTMESDWTGDFRKLDWQAKKSQ